MPLVVGELLESAALATPQRIAATLGEDYVSYGDLYVHGNQFANALHNFDVGLGDRCIVWSENSLMYLELFAGLAYCGAVFVPVISKLSVDEVMPTVEYIRPKFIVSDGCHRAAAEQVSTRSGVPLLLFDLREEDATSSDKYANLDQHSAASPTIYGGPGPEEQDLHAIFMTSGSSGKQKGVMLSHRTNWLRVFSGVGPHMPASGPGMVNMFPLSHFAGWHFVTMMWSRRRASHLVESAGADSLLSAVDRWRANEIYAIPAVWHRIFDCDKSNYDLSSLKYANTGTSKTPPELLLKLKEHFPNTTTTVSYGATEVPTISTLSDDDLFGPHGHGVGLSAPGCVVRLAADGEICVCSELMMQGYFELPDETAQAIRSGWYHTGDVGALDDGFLTVVGRKREIIRTGGETVIPAEVDAAIVCYPGVRDAGTVGIPDPVWGETVTAFLVMEEGSVAPDVNAMRDFLSDKLASFKHPRCIEIVGEIPRTNATGQVKRMALQVDGLRVSE